MERGKLALLRMSYAASSLVMRARRAVASHLRMRMVGVPTTLKRPSSLAMIVSRA